MPAQPQDRKPAKGSLFRFTDLQGKQHTLPHASKGRTGLTGRDLRDAALGGEAGQITYMFKVLEAAKPTKVALEALYAMPQTKMLEILNEWSQHGDGDGASLGE